MRAFRRYRVHCIRAFGTAQVPVITNEVEGNHFMNSKFRKRMALLISMCLLFSSLLVDTAAGTGDALDGAFPTPAAEETLEPSVTAEPTRDATVPSSDEPTVTPAVEESPEPSVTASPTPDATEPSSDEPTVTPAAEESPETIGNRKSDAQCNRAFDGRDGAHARDRRIAGAFGDRQSNARYHRNAPFRSGRSGGHGSAAL